METVTHRSTVPMGPASLVGGLPSGDSATVECWPPAGSNVAGRKGKAQRMWLTTPKVSALGLKTRAGKNLWGLDFEPSLELASQTLIGQRQKKRYHPEILFRKLGCGTQKKIGQNPQKGGSSFPPPCFQDVRQCTPGGRPDLKSSVGCELGAHSKWLSFPERFNGSLIRLLAPQGGSVRFYGDLKD